MEDPLCPTCDSDVPMDSDAKGSDIVFCPFCGVPLRVKLVNDQWELEEDY